MGKQYPHMNSVHKDFIKAQHVFFVATAAADGRVNVSPKGMDSLRILDQNRVIWLNVTGSGNETAAHILENARMTLMFTAFEGRPMTLRLYGQAAVYHPRDEAWGGLIVHFPSLPASRQIFDLSIDMVQTSCGMSIPYFDYAGERDDLNQNMLRRGEDGVKAYWQKKNQHSIDGKPTHIFEDAAT